MRQGNCFDIIFMDIEMKQIDGIRAAKTIREIDEDVQLIYISGYEEYALQLFEMRPIGFFEETAVSGSVSAMPEESTGYSGDKDSLFFL